MGEQGIHGCYNTLGGRCHGIFEPFDWTQPVWVLEVSIFRGEGEYIIRKTMLYLDIHHSLQE